jgi:aminopeptidase-like protein
MPVQSDLDLKRVNDLLEKHWKLNRSAVNSDTDILARYLAEQLDAQVLEVPSCDECLNWTIPWHWRVRKAQLRRIGGDVLCDFADNPLHLWTHSIGFKGIVSRQDLIDHHIQTDPSRPEEFIYHYHNGFRRGKREWGFSLPYKTVEGLCDDFYEVEIDADLDTNGTLKVVDAFLPGELADTVFIMAHTCHPALVSDGIGCIAIANELFHHLKARKARRYSYRFIYGPEYFAAAAYLARSAPEIIKNLRFGIYLDMLTTDEPIGFQKSMQGNSRIDHIAHNVLSSHRPLLIEREYRKLWGNDELFYDGPGFNIPTIGLGRLVHREYHYDTDNIAQVNYYHARESLWILRRIIDVFETDAIPVRRFNGPLYLSRYPELQAHVPSLADSATSNLMLVLADGTLSCQDIAQRLGLDYYQVRRFFDWLAGQGLVGMLDRPPGAADQGFMNFAPAPDGTRSLHPAD